MFTGLIQSTGTITAAANRGGDRRLRIAAAELPRETTAPGASIAVNGVCLTVVETDAAGFSADVSNETLGLTTLGALAEGDEVNLEPSLTLATPLGGHLVSGHVDGVAELVALEPDARSTRMEFMLPHPLVRYVARKGSVALDGASLTVNAVDGQRFSVNIVPHTLEKTIMKHYAAGTRVNIEVDLFARYIERLLAERDKSG